MKRIIMALLLTGVLSACQDVVRPELAEAPTTPSKSTATALSVYIDGPYELYSEGVYTWEAFPSGGDGSYTYYWEVQWDNDSAGAWIFTGEDKTASIDVRDYMGSFTLRVTVTSAGQTTESQFYVYNMMPCTSMC